MFDKNVFQQHYDKHFVKCIVCLAVFSSKEVLDSHSKEVHGASPEKIKVCLVFYYNQNMKVYKLIPKSILTLKIGLIIVSVKWERQHFLLTFCRLSWPLSLVIQCSSDCCRVIVVADPEDAWEYERRNVERNYDNTAKPGRTLY